MKRPLLLQVLLFVFASTVGCTKSPAPHSSDKLAPAKVEKLPVETEIAIVTLTPKARQRLGITTSEVTKRVISRRRVFGGEVMIPAGKSIIISAPYAGSIVEPHNGEIPMPGQRVAVGDPILSIAPLLTPERDVPTPSERVQMANARATILSALTVARGDVERTKAEVEAATVVLNRATKLLEDRVGSAREFDNAKAQLTIAQTNLTAAQQRAAQLSQLSDSLDLPAGSAGDANPLIISASQAGVIRNLLVTRGQTVTVGAPLFELASTDTIWVRVPVYVDLLKSIDTAAEAAIVGLDGRRAAVSRNARPIVAPPSADPLSSTADLYYETDNESGSLRPGQRVGVELKMQGSDQSNLMVPGKSLLYDIFGGTWVYETVGENAFQRHRVLVRFTDGEHVALASGPAAGTPVVVDGAAELYGTEFGAGK